MTSRSMIESIFADPNPLIALHALGHKAGTLPLIDATRQIAHLSVRYRT